MLPSNEKVKVLDLTRREKIYTLRLLKIIARMNLPSITLSKEEEIRVSFTAALEYRSFGRTL